jgi:putative hemolysin
MAWAGAGRCQTKLRSIIQGEKKERKRVQNLVASHTAYPVKRYGRGEAWYVQVKPERRHRDAELSSQSREPRVRNTPLPPLLRVPGREGGRGGGEEGGGEALWSLAEMEQ